jgi:hypothetical protein
MGDAVFSAPQTSLLTLFIAGCWRWRYPECLLPRPMRTGPGHVLLQHPCTAPSALSRQLQSKQLDGGAPGLGQSLEHLSPNDRGIGSSRAGGERSNHSI